MADRVSEETRSYIMGSVGTKDTGPELAVRRMLHEMGYRYRLRMHELPGTPDIVFTRRKKVIFVHGCFWHGHSCRYGRLPKSRKSYWAQKIKKNMARDERVIRDLQGIGWNSAVIWQCEIRDPESVREKLRSFLGSPNAGKRRTYET